MKARHIPRIDIHDRIELKNALPLRTPYVIYIDPCDTCNFRCKFCPSGNVELMKKTRGRGHGPMDFDVYRSIIDSLKQFPDPIRVIRLYKEGEPLLNPRFADMVRYAKQSDRVLRVDTTTNASLLTNELSLDIIDAVLGIVICKNLFLCNRQKTKYYLLLMPGEKKFRTKELSAQINSARLSFADADDMKKYLDIEPGAVSVMGLMNDREGAVQLLIDEDVLKEEWFGCHPCVNTSSLKLKTKDVVEKFLPAAGHDYITVHLTGEE